MRGPSNSLFFHTKMSNNLTRQYSRVTAEPGGIRQLAPSVCKGSCTLRQLLYRSLLVSNEELLYRVREQKDCWFPAINYWKFQLHTDRQVLTSRKDVIKIRGTQIMCIQTFTFHSLTSSQDYRHTHTDPVVMVRAVLDTITKGGCAVMRAYLQRADVSRYQVTYL